MKTTHKTNTNASKRSVPQKQEFTRVPTISRRIGTLGTAPFVVILCLPALIAGAQGNSTTSTATEHSLSALKTGKALPQSPGQEALTGKLQSQPLTIDDVVTLALANNRTLATAVESYRQSQGTTASARAGLNPTLKVNYALTRYSQEQAANLGGQSVVIQEQYVNQLNAGLNLPIDITGELHAAVNQANYQQLAARLEVNRVRNQIVLDVKSAFYEVLRDQALVNAAQGNLQNAIDRLTDAQLRLSAGTVAHIDVTRAQSDVASAQQTVIKNRSALSLAFAKVNKTIGLNINTVYMLTTKNAVNLPAGATDTTFGYIVPDVKPSPPPENGLTGEIGHSLGDHGAAQVAQMQQFVVGNPIESGADYEATLKEALRTRPEVLREDANVAAARKGIFVARAGLLPTVSIGYNINYTPNSGTLAGQALTRYAGLTVNIPLLDGGVASGRVTQAKALVSQAEIALREQMDTVALDVRQAYLNLQQTEQAIGAARQELAQADESYRLARLRYSAGVTSQAGVSPIIELSNAQQALSQAQSDYINALYDYNINLSAMDKAAGRYAYLPAAGSPGAALKSAPALPKKVNRN